MRVALLIALYGLIAAVGAIFMGTTIPPCFGSVPDGKVSQECIDHWLANRSPVEAFFRTPWPAVVAFVMASGLTIWWSRRRRRRSPGAS